MFHSSRFPIGNVDSYAGRCHLKGGLLVA